MNNVLSGLITFAETIFEGATALWNFLTTEVHFLGLSFSPIYVLVAGIGALLVAWIIKKIVPLV